MRDLWTDIRHAYQSLRRSPGFAAAAVTILALGAGVAAAVFAVVDAVLVQPLPYAAPQRVVVAWNTWDGVTNGRVSPPEYRDYQRDVHAFTAFGVFGGNAVTLSGADGRPERVAAAYITAGVLPALGVSPAVGSAFSGDDEQRGVAKVLLSDRAWRQRFAGSAAIVGRGISIDGESYTVVGVMPPGFRLPDEFASREPAQVYLPLAFSEPELRARGNHSLHGVARLRDGVAVERGNAEIDTVARAFAARMPTEYPARMHFGARVVPVVDEVTGPARRPLLVLFAAVLCVFIVACTNVASLILTRAESRRRDLAVRIALGAGRSGMLRYAAAEPIVIVGAGALLAIPVALGTLRLLPRLSPVTLPRVADATLDWRTLVFLGGGAVVAGGLLALTPMLRLRRASAHPDMSAQTRTIARGHSRTRQSLVAVQVGLTASLLVGGALLITSLYRLTSVDPGYRIDGIVAADVALPDTSYRSAERTIGLFRQLLDDVRQRSGVVAAGAVANLPLAGPGGDLNIQIEGRETAPGEVSRRADWQVVTPGYFEALAVTRVSGRVFDSRDRADAPGVVIINATMARQYWPGRDSIGARFRLGGGARPQQVTVIGVVADVRQGSLTDPPVRQMYFAHEQFRFWGGVHPPVRAMTLVVRTDRGAGPIGDDLRRALRAIDPTLPLGELRTMGAVRADSLARPRAMTFLLTAFAAIGVLVALVGLYGMVAYNVAQRRREFGVRLAIGATGASVTRLVLRQEMRGVVAGLAAGLASAVVLAPALAPLLYRVDPRDPSIAAAVAIMLLAVTAVASYVPARRAAHVDPVIALRAE